MQLMLNNCIYICISLQYIESAGVLPAERVPAPEPDQKPASATKSSTSTSQDDAEGSGEDAGDKAPSAPPGRKPRANYWEHTSASQRTSVRQRTLPDLGMIWLQRAQQLLGNRQLFPSPPAMQGPSMAVGPPPGGSAPQPTPPSLAARHIRLELMATVANMMAVRSRALQQTHTALRHLESALRQEAKLHSAAEADVSTVLDLAKAAHRNHMAEETQEEFASAYAQAVTYLAGRRKAYATCHLNAASVLSDMAKHAGATHHSNEAVRLLTTSTLDTALPWQNTERLIIGKDENKGGSDDDEGGEESAGGGLKSSTASTGGVGVASPGTLLLLGQALYGLAVQQESQKKYSAAVKTCDQGKKALHMLSMRQDKDKGGAGGSDDESESKGVGGTSLGNLPAVPKGGATGAPMDKEYVSWLGKQFDAMRSEAAEAAEAAEEARSQRRAATKASTFVQPGRRKGPQEILDRLLATATSKKAGRRPGSSQAAAAYGPGGSRPQSRGSAAYGSGGVQPVRRSGAEVGRNLMMLDPSTGRPRRSQRAEDMHRTQAERLDAPLPEIRGITGEFAVPGLSSAPTPSSGGGMGGGGFGTRSAGGGRPPKGRGKGRKKGSDPEPKEIILPGMEPVSIHDLVWAGREEHASPDSPAAPVKPGSLASVDRQSVAQYKDSFNAYDLYTQEVIDAPPDTFKEFERAFLPPSVDLHFPPLVPLVVAEAQAGTTSATGFAAPAMTAGAHRGAASHTSLGSARGQAHSHSSGAADSADSLQYDQGDEQRQPAAAPSEAAADDMASPPSQYSRPSSQGSAESAGVAGAGGGSAQDRGNKQRSGAGIDGEIHLVRAGDMQTSPHKYGSGYEY